MTPNRDDIAAGRAWAARLLGKDQAPPSAPERPPTHTERVAAWSGQGGSTSEAVTRTRAELHVPGSAFAIGAERYAADGTVWRRMA